MDESSQCDIFGLAALALADKAIIVGDDKQISPQAIGTEESAGPRADRPVHPGPSAVGAARPQDQPVRPGEDAVPGRDHAPRALPLPAGDHRVLQPAQLQRRDPAAARAARRPVLAQRHRRAHPERLPGAGNRHQRRGGRVHRRQDRRAVRRPGLRRQDLRRHLAARRRRRPSSSSASSSSVWARRRWNAAGSAAATPITSRATSAASCSSPWSSRPARDAASGP